MNSDPKNLVNRADNEAEGNKLDKLDKLNESDFKQIEGLINILVEEDKSDSVSDSALEVPTADSDSSATQTSTSAPDTSKDFNFLEQNLATPAPSESDSKLNETDIEVKIESEPQPTLEEAVKYKAFLRQTVESAALSEMKIATIEQVEAIDTSNAAPEDLAEAVNSLIPLIVGLLEFKLDHSREGIVQTVRPMLDRLIAERTAEDSPKMAAAIARILPAAIADEIKANPRAIAKAIAPEIALSIREQILLDEEAIPQTLGPEMGRAIKAQIESEKDAMVDALYPVIGSTIAKYMVEVVQDINSKVESTLSPEGIKRKFQARMQGVSEAELIFKESVGFRVRAIFLIDKDSGLVIQEIQIPGEKRLDSDMLAGMLTAIRSFANDCIAAGSELDSIDYGDWQIPIEVGGYCYLAVIVAGEPPKEFITKVRRVLGSIILEHDDSIQDFSGNLADVPLGIKHKLEQLIEVEPDKPKKSSSSILLWLLIFILGLIIVPWGVASYRTRVAQQIEQSAAIQLDAAPEISVYRLDPQVKQGKLIVKGRVPSNDLRDRAQSIVQEIAQQHQLQVDNQITTVDIPVNPSLARGEIQRLTNLFNQQSQVSIETVYQANVLTVKGFVLEESTRQTMGEAFSQIPGVKQVVFDLAPQLPMVKQQIYFNSGASTLDFADNFSKINAVKDVLQRHPQLYLRLIAHSDGIGSSKINQELSKKRCQSVKTALVARGIASQRLTNSCDSLLLPKNKDNDRAAWLKRYVSFEPFIPPNPSQ
ncbi:MAG: OmpA family protein [Cyanobacteria bacterium J06631_2]